MAKRTLDNHRWKGTGPKFRRHGGRIVYRRCDLLAWSEQRAARLRTEKPHVGNPRLLTLGVGPAMALPAALAMPKAKRSNAALEYQPKRSTGLYMLTTPRCRQRKAWQSSGCLKRQRGRWRARLSATGALLIKPVAAAGDVVCRHGTLVITWIARRRRDFASMGSDSASCRAGMDAVLTASPRSSCFRPSRQLR